jgi:PH/SEC7 domain-containing protein
VRRYLASNASHQEIEHSLISSSTIINNSSSRGHRVSSSDSSACRKSRIPVNNARTPSSAPQSPQTVKPRYQSHIPISNGQTPPPPSAVQKKQNPRFEAYMMTGDLILNLSRTPQSTNLIAPAQAKKSTMDSLRDSPMRSLKRKNGVAPKAIYDSSPSESSSASINELGSYEICENHDNNNEENRKISKLSRFNPGNSNTTNESLDEEEEQLLMEESNNPSSLDDERKLQYKISKGCVNNTSSSSSSASSPTNSSNSSSNNNSYDGGGYSNNKNDHASAGSLQQGTKKTYSVLQNEDGQEKQQQQRQNTNSSNLKVRKELTPSASMSSTTTTTSSASTTINRSETLLTPTLDVSRSVPTSPTSLSTPLLEATKRRDVNSVPTSPECQQMQSQEGAISMRRNSSNVPNQQNGVPYRKCDASGFRTSRSEDHLQHSQREGLMGNAIPIDIDEDINSSLNTLLDTRHDSEDSQNSNRDRIVWTYNAPVMQNSTSNNPQQGVVSPTSSSISTSPQHTDSPASPTSVSSSVMSSSGSKGNGLNHTNGGGGGGQNSNAMFLSSEQSVSEAISNISSPDYHDENDLLSSRDLSAAMAISDPSDSDSTLIVDQVKKEKEPKAVIQVSEGFKSNAAAVAAANEITRDPEDELAAFTNEQATIAQNSLQELQEHRGSSPPISDDGSDVESLHSFHYSPKAVDMPSAVRLAKRLFTLDGFKKSDVSRHLSKK